MRAMARPESTYEYDSTRGTGTMSHCASAQERNRDGEYDNRLDLAWLCGLEKRAGVALRSQQQDGIDALQRLVRPQRPIVRHAIEVRQEPLPDMCVHVVHSGLHV